MYDPDRIDAEIQGSRQPNQNFDTESLAMLLRVSKSTVLKRLQVGRLPRPEVFDGTATLRPHVWSRRQAIEILLAQPPWEPKPITPIPHGEERGYKAHKRRDEEPCEACRFAHAEHMRAYNKSRRMHNRRAMAK